MDYNKAALELHSKFPGKIAVQSLCECKDRDALSTAYTPGVAAPALRILSATAFASLGQLTMTVWWIFHVCGVSRSRCASLRTILR